MNNFSNREIAIMIWSGILFILLLGKSDIRKSCWEFLTFFLSKIPLVGSFIIACQVFSLLVSYMLYFTNTVHLFNSKEAVMWFLFVGIPITYSSYENMQQDNQFLLKQIISNLKFIVLVEFFINFYVLPLLIEILLFPIITILYIFHMKKRLQEIVIY